MVCGFRSISFNNISISEIKPLITMEIPKFLPLISVTTFLTDSMSV